MNTPTTKTTPPGRRARGAARAASARRRRTGWIATLVALLAVSALVIGLHVSSRSTPATGAGPVATLGQAAPAGQFTTVTGQPADLGSLGGRPTLVWFVATWCSSCQAGTQVMGANINRFKAAGVNVDELELYQNLGQPGPDIAHFGQTFAGKAYTTSTNWQFGTASAALTRSYDPQSYLDIYYLIDRTGKIVYVNGSPASTMPDLLAQVGKLA